MANKKLIATVLTAGLLLPLALFIIFKVDSKQGMVRLDAEVNNSEVQSHISIFKVYGGNEFGAVNCEDDWKDHPSMTVDYKKCQRASDAVWAALATFIAGTVMVIGITFYHYVTETSMTPRSSMMFLEVLVAVGISNIVTMAFIVDYAVNLKQTDDTVGVTQTTYALQFGLTLVLLFLNVLWMLGLAFFSISTGCDLQSDLKASLTDNILQ